MIELLKRSTAMAKCCTFYTISFTFQIIRNFVFLFAKTVQILNGSNNINDNGSMRFQFLMCTIYILYRTVLIFLVDCFIHWFLFSFCNVFCFCFTPIECLGVYVYLWNVVVGAHASTIHSLFSFAISSYFSSISVEMSMCKSLCMWLLLVLFTD